MSTPLKKAANADIFTKSIIFGYIKRIPNISNIASHIPMTIKYLILLFYSELEWFETVPKDIDISNNKMTITKKKYAKLNWANVTFCKNLIPATLNKIVKWTFKINKYHQKKISLPFYQAFCIRIQTKDTRDRNQRTNDTFYEFTSDGSLFEHGMYELFRKHGNGRKFRENDIVTVILNLKNRQILQQINDEMCVILWSNIEINASIYYRIAITIRHPQNSISMFRYHQYL
eukprot:116381_1